MSDFISFIFFVYIVYILISFLPTSGDNFKSTVL